MKRSLLIILGVVVILVLLAVWVYVLLRDPAPTDPQFADFNLGDTTAEPAAPAPTETEPTVDVAAAPLRQLTTKPVAGYAEVQLATSSVPQVYYVEAGTGHIFGIDTETGAETRVSATTIPRSAVAAITPNGAHVLIQAGWGPTAEFIIGTLVSGSDELSNFALGEAVTTFTATTDNELLFAHATGDSTTVSVYNPRDNSTRDLFNVPLRDVEIAWHHTTNGPHLVYPKAARQLRGMVYQYNNGQLERLPLAGYGLSAVGSSQWVLQGSAVGDDYQASSYDTTTGIEASLPVPLLPEKCAFAAENAGSAVCGVSLGDTSGLPDSWYRGTLTTSDNLWRVRPGLGSATVLLRPVDVAGRSIDLYNPNFNLDGTHFYFQNKIDHTLWVFDLTS